MALPYANTDAMQHHLRRSRQKVVAKGAHAVLLLDRAGWHTTAKLKLQANISLLFLRTVCHELNAAENIWQYLRKIYLSN